MLSQQFIDWVLETGEDDEVQFTDLDYLLNEDTGDDTNLIERTVDAAIELIDAGYLVPGEMTEGRFRPWRSSREETVQRLRAGQQQVLNEGTMLKPGDICMFRASSYEGPEVY